MIFNCILRIFFDFIIWEAPINHMHSNYTNCIPYICINCKGTPSNLVVLVAGPWCGRAYYLCFWATNPSRIHPEAWAAAIRITARRNERRRINGGSTSVVGIRNEKLCTPPTWIKSFEKTGKGLVNYCFKNLRLPIPSNKSDTTLHLFLEVGII